MVDVIINGQRLDLAPDTQVTLNFKSNLFGNIDKINASNSYTVKVPKTVRNRAILDNPTAPAYRSAFRYKRHACRVEQNGIEIVNGYAVLLASGEAYELGLYWGGVSRFQAWVDEDKSINELPEVEAVEWSKDVAFDTPQSLQDRGFGWAKYDFGITNTELANVHPSVTAKYIFDAIAEEAGYTYDLPDGYDLKLAELAIPAIEAVGSPLAWSAEALKGFGQISSFVQSFSTLSYLVALDFVDPRGVFLRNELKSYGGATFSASVFSTLGSNEVRIRFADFNNPTRYSAGASLVIIGVPNDGGTQNVTLKSYSAFPTAGGYALAMDDVLDMEGYDEFYIAIRGVVSSTSIQTWRITELIVEPHFDELVYPSAFGVMANLPDIKQTKFINAVNAMLGLFVMPDLNDPTHLHFVTLDQLMGSKSRAVDWSARLIYGTDEDPEEVAFAIGDYAQRNIFAYKEDEDVATDGNGVIVIDNEALELEAEIVELPFAASDGSKIVQYELNDEGTEAERVSVTARIMRITEDAAGNATLTFDGLGWPSLIAEHYKAMTQLLREAIVIKERFRVSEIDLLNLDYMRPVYLNQYGRYYGVQTVQVNGSTANVELVQLPSANVTNRIMSMIGTIGAVMSERPVASDVTVTVQYTDANGETKTRDVVILAGDSEAYLMESAEFNVEEGSGTTPYAVVGNGGALVFNVETGAVETAYNLRVVAVSPSADFVYNYEPYERQTLIIGTRFVANDLYLVSPKPVTSLVGASLNLLNASMEVIGSTVAELQVGDTEVLIASGITRDFGGIEVVAYAPPFDDNYIYIVTNIEQ